MLTSVVLLAFLQLYSTVTSGTPIYGAVYGTIDLSPGPVSEKITTITWKHQDNIALEWLGGAVSSYRQFKNDCSLNTDTGVMTISKLSLVFSGKYTAEINNNEVGSQEVQVLYPVPKPGIFHKCSEDKEKTTASCVLTCDNDIPPNTKPLNYSWIVDNKEMFTTKDITITENNGTSFICVMKNPVSTKSSDALLNPLKRKEGNNSGASIGIIFSVILIILGILLVLFIFIVKKTNRLDDCKLIHDMREKGLKKGLISSCSNCRGNKDNGTKPDADVDISGSSNQTSYNHTDPSSNTSGHGSNRIVTPADVHNTQTEANFQEVGESNFQDPASNDGTSKETEDSSVNGTDEEKTTRSEEKKPEEEDD